MNIQLYFYGFLNLEHIFLRKNANAAKEPCLTDSRQLVGHSLTFLACKNHCCLAGIEPIRLAGERDDLNSIEEPIRCVVTDDRDRPLLFDFPTDGGIKVNPPYLTPFHGLRP